MNITVNGIISLARENSSTWARKPIPTKTIGYA